MKTGKALGFKKGDFVHTGFFPGIIIQDVHTFTPMCEVWGIEHEMGSGYAYQFKKLTAEEFFSAVDLASNPPYSKEAKRAIQDAKQVTE